MVSELDCIDCSNLLNKKNKEIEKLKAEVKKYKEVVEWYAHFAGTTAINHDYGKKAMKVLGLTIKDI